MEKADEVKNKVHNDKLAELTDAWESKQKDL